jgi:phage terminase large subunit
MGGQRTDNVSAGRSTGEPQGVDITLPEALQCLFSPSRYKVMYGGRGASRSWSVARTLLAMGAQRPIRVLCARELQNSITDSVHLLLRDQIVLMGLENFYEVQQARIIGANGTSFAFEGIKNNTTKIKSYEGIDYCWVEEAVKVSRSSWGILIPTVRRSGSEIWLTFNPELDTDYTYKRFVLEKDDSMIVVRMTYRDNPWFPDVLRDEMERDKARDYDYYLNVWEGHCLQMLEGTVYAKELRRATEENRICTVPWQREWPVDTFWDLGRADATAIWFAQRVAMQYRILAYYENTGFDITHYMKELQNREYIYGTVWLPHDGAAKRLGSKRTIEEMLRDAGHKVRIVPKLSPTDGINAARIIFPNCWFDEDECADGLNALRHYRYKVEDGHLKNTPVHDWASDGADAFRYMAVALQQPRPSSTGAFVSELDNLKSSIRKRLGRMEIPTGLGWMR